MKYYLYEVDATSLENFEVVATHTFDRPIYNDLSREFSLLYRPMRNGDMAIYLEVFNSNIYLYIVLNDEMTASSVLNNVNTDMNFTVEEIVYQYRHRTRTYVNIANSADVTRRTRSVLTALIENKLNEINSPVTAN